MDAAGFYRASQTDGAGTTVTYAPLSNAGQHSAELKSLLGLRAEALGVLIGLLRDFGTEAVEAVATMNRIAEKIEQEPTYSGIIDAQRAIPEPTAADAISLAARQIAETLKLAAIVTYTASGTTGLRAARERPRVPIVALSPVLETTRRLSLVWGLHCVMTEDAHDQEDMVNRACNIVNEQEFGKPGDRIIIIAGVPFGTPGSTNMLRVAYIGADGHSGL